MSRGAVDLGQNLLRTDHSNSPSAVNYRLAPETKFPGQLHDAVSAYMRLTVDLKIPPQNIVSEVLIQSHHCDRLTDHMHRNRFSLETAPAAVSAWLPCCTFAMRDTRFRPGLS